MKLADGGGTFEQEMNDQEKCCVEDEDLLRLGNIAIKVHVNHYI